MVLLPFRCLFRQLLPLKRGYANKVRVAWVFASLASRRNVRGSNGVTGHGQLWMARVRQGAPPIPAAASVGKRICRGGGCRDC